MSEILVKTNIMTQCVSSEQAMMKKLNSLAGEIERVQRNLSFNVKSRARISSQLSSLSKVTQRNADRMSSLASVLSNAAGTYSSTEKRISGNVNGTSLKKDGNSNASNRLYNIINGFNISDVFPWFMQLLKNMLTKVGKISSTGKNGSTTAWDKLAEGIDSAMFSGAVSASGSIFGYASAISLSGNALGGSASIKGGASWNLDDGDAGANYSVNGEVHAAQGKIAGKIGSLGGDANLTVGKIGASGEVGVTLFKDGKLNPSIEAGLSAEAKGLEGEGNIKLGSEDNNLHGKAEGTLFGAEANASAGAGKITYENSNGKTVSGYGVKGEVGAEAYLAEGKLSGGFNLFGVEIDASVSGKAGGAGAEAGGHITTNGVSGKIGAGLGVGGGVEINIDWSNFSLKKVEDFWKGLFK